MNFKQVEAFRAVMSTRSMTAAAGLLHTSQPNVSRWIGLLERSLGFPLFRRSGTRLIPTPEGSAFHADVERAFGSLASLQDSAESIRRRGTGALRVAAVSSLTQSVVPEALRLFRASYPETPVIVNTGSSDAVAKWTATGSCDVGFCSIPGDIPTLTYERINTATGVAIVDRTHALARKRVMKPADFSGESFISLPSGSINRHAIDAHFRGVARTLSVETPYASTICSMVAKGLGVSIVNPVVLRSLHLPEIREIRFSERVEFHSYAVMSEHFPASVLATRMARCVKDAFRALDR